MTAGIIAGSLAGDFFSAKSVLIVCRSLYMNAAIVDFWHVGGVDITGYEGKHITKDAGS